MSVKPILFTIALALGSTSNAVPKTPKAQLKRAPEIAKCQAQLKAITAASTAAELSQAAQCQLWIAEQSYAKFTALKLPKAFDKDKLERWLESSKTQREETSALYLQVKGFGEPEQSVAALARIGLMSYQFATGLDRSPLPSSVEYDMDGDGVLEQIKLKGELKAQVQEAVKAELTKLSAPIYEDARGAFEACAKEAKDKGVESNWSKLCVEYVSLLTPTAETAPAQEPAEAPTPEPQPEVLFR